MPRGIPLTPEQVEQAGEVFARTGSYSEAARAIGAPDPSTVRKALLRRGDPVRSQLNARAIDRGLREGRRALAENVKLLHQQQQGTGKTKPTASKLVSIAKGLSMSVGRLCDLAKDQRERRAASLQRQKLRAETELLRSKAAGTAAPDTVVLSASDPRFADLQRQVFGASRQGAAEADGRDGTDHGVAAGDVPPVPAPVDPR